MALSHRRRVNTSGISVHVREKIICQQRKEMKSSKLELSESANKSYNDKSTISYGQYHMANIIYYMSYMSDKYKTNMKVNLSLIY